MTSTVRTLEKCLLGLLVGAALSAPLVLPGDWSRLEVLLAQMGGVGVGLLGFIGITCLTTRLTRQVVKTPPIDVQELTDSPTSVPPATECSADTAALAANVLEAAWAEAERANRTKSQFVANMSHEIRTPMTAILGYVDMLLEDVDAAGPQAEKWRQQLSTIKNNGQHLIEIINDILDISKIEAGKVTAELIDSPLVPLVGDVATLLRHRAEAKGLVLRVNFLTPMPDTIETDPTRLRQILLNLVGNSIKFTETGEVRIEVSLIGRDSGQPRVQIDVIDSGIGMTDEQITRLFQPFVQADNSTTRKYGGSGLGLAISKRLAELLGGGITATSHPNRGSMFRVTFLCGPLTGVRWIEHPSNVLPPPPVPVARKSELKLNCRVLIAEDGPDNQRFLSYLLRQAGADVEVVDNGQAAVDWALRAWRGPSRRTSDPDRPFDVILMDMQMPILDGCQAAARLREAGYPLPIIALTANAMREDRDRCLAAGCDDFATKPIDRTVLLSTIVRWMESGHRARAEVLA